MEQNKIYSVKIKIKNILQNLREESYTKDDTFLNNIESIKIDLGNTVELKNLNFCLAKDDFINAKTKKLEKFVIFSTLFQLKIMSECN